MGRWLVWIGGGMFLTGRLIVLMILLSVVLTVALNLILRLRR